MSIKGQPNRVAGSAAALIGREIDRTRPLTFRLNGRELHGFAGDTVLSAALASGVVQAGWQREQPLALDERFAPPVVPRESQRDRKLALPMDRLPAIAGLDLVSLGSRRRNPSEIKAFVTMLLGGPASSLEHEFGGKAEISAPWTDAPPEQRIETGLVIVGGGIAGLRAAVAAGSTGESVVLLERLPRLGGDARFFGSIDDEEPPGSIITGLMERIAELKSVTVLTLTEAFAILGREIRAHQVVAGDKQATGRVIAISAPRIVLAPGSFERLPVFDGNRVPRVTRAVAAFNLADRYGVWIGRNALINTASGFAYRVAVEAQKAGLAVQRITDTRLQPQSRFIDFSMAWGVPLSYGVTPQGVSWAGRDELDVRLLTANHRGEPQTLPFTAGQFLVCGGWQPELGLWHMAGGQSRWVAAANRVEPVGRLDGIEIVGAAAGWRSNTACMQSAAAGVDLLLGRRPERIEERLIDAAFETPDDPTPISPPEPDGDGIAYLDAGHSLTERPAAPRPRGLGRWFGRSDRGTEFLSHARALTVGDIAAAVQLGAVAPLDAGTLAQERCVLAGDIVEGATVVEPAGPLATPIDGPPYPAYLEGRFGSSPRVWRIETGDRRTFETGCLIYRNADDSDPAAAVGVILRAEPEGATGLLGGERVAGEALIVRDISGPVAVKLAGGDKPPETPAG